mmetsp:Transcript_30056/g.102150  ORF Transcript_30056/g.102150 Transcript_30056/m.102150 type:complete len:290 (-) Transcript_30056:34-903(-)
MARTYHALLEDGVSVVFHCLLRACIILRAILFAGPRLTLYDALAGLWAIPQLLLYALGMSLGQPVRRFYNKADPKLLPWDLAAARRRRLRRRGIDEPDSRREWMLRSLRSIWIEHARNIVWNSTLWVAQRRHDYGEPRLTMCELMAVHEDEVDSGYPGGHSLLTTAAKQGHVEIVTILIRRKVSLEFSYRQRNARAIGTDVDKDAPTAVVIALDAGHHEIVRLLLRAGARRRCPELRREYRKMLWWELVRARSLAEAGRGAPISDSLQIISGVHGYLPDGPFNAILMFL